MEAHETTSRTAHTFAHSVTGTRTNDHDSRTVRRRCDGEASAVSVGCSTTVTAANVAVRTTVPASAHMLAARTVRRCMEPWRRDRVAPEPAGVQPLALPTHRRLRLPVGLRGNVSRRAERERGVDVPAAHGLAACIYLDPR